MGLTNHLIVKREKEDDALIIVLCMEEFYEKLLEVHQAVGHWGRDRLQHFFKNKYLKPRSAVKIFDSSCKTVSEQEGGDMEVTCPFCRHESQILLDIS